MRKFRKHKPFGSIRPHYNGAVYEQDGYYFDGAYECLFCDDGLDMDATNNTETVVSEVVTTERKEDGTVERKVEKISTEVDIVDEDERSDQEILIAWCTKSDTSIRFKTAQKAARQEYGKVFANGDDLAVHLVLELGLVAAEDNRR